MPARSWRYRHRLRRETRHDIRDDSTTDPDVAMQHGADALGERRPRIPLQHHAACTELEASHDVLIVDMRGEQENSTEST